MTETGILASSSKTPQNSPISLVHLLFLLSKASNFAHYLPPLIKQTARIVMRRLDITLPPEPARAPSQSSAGEHDVAVATNSNFDTNMIIILAALLGALVCAVGINSIVRCTFRCCRHRLTFVGPPKEQHTGLTKKELRKLPVEVYRKPGNDDDDEQVTTECPICLSEFADKEMHRVLPVCRHRFHTRCVDKWLGSNCTCPTCRRSVLPDHVK